MTQFTDRLTMLKAMVKPQAIGVEIGVQRGAFAAQILSELQPARLYLVDCWAHQPGDGYIDDPANIDQGGHDCNYRHVLKLFSGRQSVRIIKGFSPQILDAITEKLDFAYIDARHDYQSVFFDLLAVNDLMKPDGLIAGHDYTIKNGFGVIDAVTQFCKASPWKLVAVTTDEWPSFALKQ